MIGRADIAVMTCVLATLSGAVSAAAAPSQKGGKSAELERAVAELRREYAQHVKDPAGRPLRTACDYFSAGGSPTISADAVLLALEKPLASGPRDARESAYVKWQLLSALPETIDDAMSKRLVKVYERAPAPAARYSCSAQEKKQLDAALKGARHQDDVKLTEQLEALVKRGQDADAPVIAYRDELYRRLPAGRDKFVAALRDAHERISLAAPKDTLAEALEKDLPTWAVGAGDGEQAKVREVAELLGKLRFVESPPYYESAGVRRGKLTWVTETDTLLTTKRLATLHKVLLDAAAATAASNSKSNNKKAGNDS